MVENINQISVLFCLSGQKSILKWKGSSYNELRVSLNKHKEDSSGFDNIETAHGISTSGKSPRRDGLLYINLPPAKIFGRRRLAL